MTRLFAKQALLPGGWARDVRVTLSAEGRIGAVEVDAAQGSDDVDLGDRVLLPAPGNLHSHAFQRAMAGMTEHRSSGRDSFWTWRELMYRFVRQLTPEQIEAIAALVYMEMLESGYAAVGEFHYIHHRPSGQPYERLTETTQRVFAAAAETGIGLTHLPVLYSYGGAGEQALKVGQIRFANDLDGYSTLVQEARSVARAELPVDARVGIAPHSLRATSPQQFKGLLRAFRGGPVHIHIAEQPAEVEEVVAWLGDRPVAWLLNRFEVDAHWCLVHATQMTGEETAALARSGAVAGLCPITESNLGDGIFNGPGFTGAGGSFGIGSDSNVRISLSEELRVLEYSQRLRDRARNVLLDGEGSVGGSLYRHVLAGGARALGRESGAIRTGLFADLVALDGEDIAFHGADGDGLLDAWIFAADDRVVTDVWSAGRHCVEDGRHKHHDAIVARYRRATRSLFSQL
ncbi:MAG: formimidoylglutamate deiminase [Gammaproteobacteria bacterium]|nr:formimidoylglutamate deiminase [Gammaproteobacteria bacterium]